LWRVVALEPGASVQADDVGRALASDLAAFKRPKAIVIVDELPRNAMGKVQKAELRGTHKNAFTQTGS